MTTTLLAKTRRKNINIKPTEEEDLLLYNMHIKDNPKCWNFLNDKEKASFEKEIGL